MESNGKRVTHAGQCLTTPTAPSFWGEPGTTNGQHAFFSCCTRGQDVVPVEFIVARGGGKYLGAHQHSLVINAIAQAQALMLAATAWPTKIAQATGPAVFTAAAVQSGLGRGLDRFV